MKNITDAISSEETNSVHDAITSEPEKGSFPFIGTQSSLINIKFVTYKPSPQDSIFYWILEWGVELKKGLEETLESLKAIDLLEIFGGENIEPNELMDLDLNDLIHLGVSSERAQEFLNSRQNEDERKKKLEKMLQDVDCAELYGCLVGKGYTAETVLSINYDILKEIGLSFQERKKVLKKINDEKSKLGNVSRIISKLVQNVI